MNRNKGKHFVAVVRSTGKEGTRGRLGIDESEKTVFGRKNGLCREKKTKAERGGSLRPDQERKQTAVEKGPA